ncbi:FAD dependent oxidoreductase [Thozetella sp. PMI_491]|nr:FAD dependent oxidoreductase [Thozetella sp. PMI_491]
MPRICVLGSGIIGLASATLLVDAGYEVVVVARDMPGDPAGLSWASPSAGAIIQPGPDLKPASRELQAESFKYYWALANRDPTSGVQIIPTKLYLDISPTEAGIWGETVFPGYRNLKKDELPASVPFGVTMKACAANPTALLPWLKNSLEERGVKFIRFTVTSLEQLLELTNADALVNATGLGARTLANDPNVVPVGGQTMFIRNKAHWDHIILRQGGAEYTYAIPRLLSGGVIVGGTRKVGSVDTSVDTELKKDILRRINRIAGDAFADVDVEKDVEDIVGFRPGREGGYRLEREGKIIHAYGFDGKGYAYSFGAAKKVTKMVGELFRKTKANL